ncbi:hypothetical protein AB0F91_45730 [Amycolatopsis sp. NPDC023774]
MLKFLLPTGASPVQPVFRVALGVSGLAFALAGAYAPVFWRPG